MPNDLLICTDLDRTLMPNGPQAESPGARDRFAELVARPEVRLAYVSGRSLDLMRDAMRHYDLPRPDYVITDVGTNIHEPLDGDWGLVKEWHDHIGADWGDFDHAAIKALLADIPEIRTQEPAKQERYKLSFYVPLYLDPDALKETITHRLETHGVRANLIYSVDEPVGIGLLDLLPASASKFHAIEFLLERLGLPLEACLFAGDSGNDTEVLISPIPAVLVANGAEDVRRDVVERAGRAGNGDRLYCARGGFEGMNGNYAAGILEGVAHYHPDMTL
jgi:HAD superfamily hydrolase (TIGR01484 family)